ncbi:Carbon starvation induced regulator [uncultured Flavonifractor sp.]|nr:Carbon starvation induced regulator [uncultured Flavonifractor sp.]
MAKLNRTVTVYEQLKEKIENGSYSPAESLPEVELATEYDVSRNTIKKALLMLENDFYVTLEPNKGAKVRSYSKKEVLDYLQLRVELEGFIVRLAVPQFSDEDISRLEFIFQQMGVCCKNNDLLQYSALNQQFHAIIYDVCPNRAATDLLLRLKAQMRKYNGKTILVPNRDTRSHMEHGAILEAIKRRDPIQAEAKVRAHVESVRQTFDDYFSLLF